MSSRRDQPFQVSRHVSLWHATAPERGPDAPLSHDRRADVVIVGAGFTGLWTARSLLAAEPDLDVAVIDAAEVGFGASGRNGGWCSALFPLGHDALARAHGHAAASAMADAMRGAIDDVESAARADGIDCDFARGGTLTLATHPAHVERIRHGVDAAVDERWLDEQRLAERVRAHGALGAAFTPHCAAIHPLKLARGLADSVSARGASIYGRTRATAIAPGMVITDRGTLRARHILRCTEGYTGTIRGLRRRVAPVYSLMIATEPLPDSAWDEIGLASRETFTDGRHLIIYGQRTADGRFAFGGRGAPYRFGSRISPGQDSDRSTFDELESVLRGLFPQIGGARITHRWGGPLGVPRDWMASVGLDRRSGIGWAGGYVGDGVSTTNLAGRTLAALCLGSDDPITRLPWVGHRSRSWEPEPLRWAGITLGQRLAAAADRSELATGRPSRVAGGVLSRLTGGH